MAPNAAPRRSDGQRSAMIAVTTGWIPPAPSAWTMRPPTSAGNDVAKALPAEPATKSARHASRIVLRPRRSASRPITGCAIREPVAYVATIQPISARSAPSDRAIPGSKGPNMVSGSARANTASMSGASLGGDTITDGRALLGAASRSGDSVAEPVDRHRDEEQRQIQHREAVHQALAALRAAARDPDREREECGVQRDGAREIDDAHQMQRHEGERHRGQHHRVDQYLALGDVIAVHGR